MARRHEVRILREMCKGCGICVRFCPAGVLEMSGELTPRGYHPPVVRNGRPCRGCRTCELMCPDLAIFIEEPARGTENEEGGRERGPNGKRVAREEGKKAGAGERKNGGKARRRRVVAGEPGAA